LRRKAYITKPDRQCAIEKLVIFDLDGTLAASKSSLDAEMASLLRDLLDVVQVAIISTPYWHAKELLSREA
jgi:phosphomannomutase